MRKTNKIFGAIIAASFAVSSLTACVPGEAKLAEKTTSQLAEDNLESYVTASFDDIYGGEYHTYNVMYEGIPSSYEYEIRGEDYPLVSIFFYDEGDVRNIVAFCEGGCSCGNYEYPSNIAINRIKTAYEEKLPIRVYGKQDGPTIWISSISYLIGPGRWQNLELTYDSGNTYPTPTQEGGE